MSREKHIPNLPRLREVEGMEEDNEAAAGIQQAYQLGDQPSESARSCGRNPSGWPCCQQQVLPEVRK